jgi:hypothetical protein
VTDTPLATQKNYLLDQPQRFGLLPTWWFWNRKDHWALVRGGFALLAGATVFVVSLLDLTPLAAGLVAALTITLALGLLERGIRLRVRKRLAASDGSPALTGSPPEQP